MTLICCVLLIFVFFSFTGDWNMKHVHLNLSDGPIRGQVLTSARDGENYFSFKGIPYAEPPIGSLRFQPPRQVRPWINVLDAFKEGPTCPSNILGKDRYLESSREDCLYLNVYSRELPIKNNHLRKPVMVWIHGGGFVNGNGNSELYGPDYLVLKETVLVTINYRLGALGFLSLQNEVCPGNNGLKDQIEALRWVRRNIAAFGGDPENVTIFGESAGGVSVQYHMLSQQSKGLFHRAISQSGSVLNPRAKALKPVECAFTLGEILGFKTDSKITLLQFLKTVRPEELVKAADKVMKIVQPDHVFLKGAFGPVIEPDIPGALITEPLEKLVNEGRFHDVPYIVGVNTLEGLILAPYGLPELKSKSDTKVLLPINLKVTPGSALADDLLDKIHNFYFKDGYSEERFASALSAIYYWTGNHRALRGLSNSKRVSPTFFYVFTLEGLSIFGKFLHYNDWRGTYHGDEIPYLLYGHLLKPKVVPGSPQDEMIDIMCQFWVDFATTGNPTPKNHLWPVYTTKDNEYLNIGPELKTEKDFRSEEMAFWDSIFEEIEDAS